MASGYRTEQHSSIHWEVRPILHPKWKMSFLWFEIDEAYVNSYLHGFFFLIFIYLFIYLWLCWVFVSVRGLSLVAASGGHSSSRCAGLSLSRPLLLRSTGFRRAGSVVVAHGPSCSAACGIFPDQGSNPCPLYWQADSQPLHHQGSSLHGFWYQRWILKICTPYSDKSKTRQKMEVASEGQVVTSRCPGFNRTGMLFS